MNNVSSAYAYPVTLTADEQSGGYVVTFLDLPEAITQGENAEDALCQAEDCLEEAIANRIMMNIALPEPSAPAHGQEVVCLPAPTAVKAAFYSTTRGLELSKVELAAILGVDEKEVRRLLDPYHPSKLNRIDELLRRLGVRLVVGLRSGSSSAETGLHGRGTPRTAVVSTPWDAESARRKASDLYLVSRRDEKRGANPAETQVAS